MRTVRAGWQCDIESVPQACKHRGWDAYVDFRTARLNSCPMLHAPLSVVALAAAAVTGIIGNHETFSGTMTPSGFAIATVAGIHCHADGDFRFNYSGASGLLSCDDGRKGDFMVTLGRTEGDGIGHMGKEWITFTVEGFHKCPAIQNPLYPDRDCDR